MRTNARSLQAAVAALFLAATAVAISGCSPVAPLSGQAVQVKVTYDVSTNKAVTLQKKIQLSFGKKN